MSQSKSNLLNYIHHLMHDDSACRKFLVDPISDAEGEWGVTKAERAVLRRTVSGLSNNSVNGYSIDRDINSYRRSLRLLQNVLHNVGAKMIHDVMATDDALYYFHLMVYYPTVSGEANFTCQNNAAVAADSSPYANATQLYTIGLTNPNPTIKEVMDSINSTEGDPIPYTTVNIGGDEYVNSFLFGGNPIIANLNDPCYDLNQNPNADSVFWFYSINGRANPATSGAIGTSFADQNINSGDAVFWQLIAPDYTYGFQSCAPHKQNKYAKDKMKA